MVLKGLEQVIIDEQTSTLDQLSCHIGFFYNFFFLYNFDILIKYEIRKKKILNLTKARCRQIIEAMEDEGDGGTKSDNLQRKT